MQGKWADLDDILKNGLQHYNEPSLDRDRLLLLQAQTLIFRGLLNEARNIISNGITTIQYYPATVSSIYYLYELTGDLPAGEMYLSDVVSRLENISTLPSSTVFVTLGQIARLFRQRGMCNEASRVYEQILSTCELDSSQRLVTTAKLVECLSHTEDGAQKYMQRLPEVNIFIFMKYDTLNMYSCVG